jgi:hypothetical protein
LVWIGNTNGKYSVKSAYHLEKERIARNQGECSTSSHYQRVWKRIWSLEVPGVVRTFLWRMCTNSLPHKANLFKRKVTPDALCPLCGKCPETTVHILWTCDSAKAVWTECSRRVQKLSIEAHDGFSLFSQLLDLLDDNELAEVIFIARRIWLRRNSILFGGVLSSPAQLVQQSIASLQEFRTAEPSPEPRVLVPRGRRNYGSHLLWVY